MYEIKKLRANCVIDFAAEELKKYLRMMMPEAGNTNITYDPTATDGSRLGFAEDFGLTFDEAKDPVLDDVVHIDTDEKGGILTGSNPRSVLFAVYRYLKENGCRWLLPGVDGEYIPVQDVVPVKYHKLADVRFRGHCNEGAESQLSVLETIDFYAKQEINAYMLEFDIPYVYYNRYYSHEFNKNRKPEPVSPQQVKQWKRACEAEIEKRGLMFHDMLHGWTAEPFGLNSTEGWVRRKVEVSDEVKKHLALVNGKRDIWDDMAIATELCMSQPETQEIFAKSVVDYAENHQNCLYLHVGLADAVRNHCECENCQKLTPSDYYVDILNRIDEMLTERNLPTRIVFAAYHDTAFPPLEKTLKNPGRFALLYAPIQRSYTSSMKRSEIGEAAPYIRNAWKDPKSVRENAAFLLEWQKSFPGCCFSYEYHFWTHIFRDPGGMEIARRIYEDIQALDEGNLQGFVEDGSQRAFFPHGFPIYVYAEALRDRSRSFESIRDDYFKYAFGEAAEEALSCFTEMSKLFDFGYMEREKSLAPETNKYYNPPHAEDLAKVKDVAARERALAEKYSNMPTRPQTVSMRLLGLHADYAEWIAKIMAARAVGDREGSDKLLDAFSAEFGVHEAEWERYYDHFMVVKTLGPWSLY